ncbi:MAG: hypothetical protein QM820_22965 [Minicystis sp.]
MKLKSPTVVRPWVVPVTVTAPIASAAMAVTVWLKPVKAML